MSKTKIVQKKNIPMGQPDSRPVARNIQPQRGQLMLSKIISDYLGKDEKTIMFRKVKDKLYLFVVKSKAMGKIPLNQKPKAYPISQNENLWTLIYKLIQEEKQMKKKSSVA